MLKAVGYIIFYAGVAVLASGALTGCTAPAVSGGITKQAGNPLWQEASDEAQEACDSAISKLATDEGVTAEKLQDENIQRILRQLRWDCMHKQGYTL